MNNPQQTKDTEWTEEMTQKLLRFYQDKNLPDRGTFNARQIIGLLKYQACRLTNDTNNDNALKNIRNGIQLYGTDNYQAFCDFKDSIEPFTKILLQRCPANGSRQAKKSIGTAIEQLMDIIQERCRLSSKDISRLSMYLEEGETWRNKWHHNTPPKTDTNTHESGCQTALLYIFAVTAILRKILAAKGGVRFTPDCPCEVLFGQGEKKIQLTLPANETFQIEGQPGDYWMQITATREDGRSQIINRKGTIEKNKYVDETLRLGQDSQAERRSVIAINPLLDDDEEEEPEAGIPYQGGTYTGPLNAKRQPHGVGTFSKAGISFGGRFNHGQPVGSFHVACERFEYKGTIQTNKTDWTLRKGEMTTRRMNKKDGREHIYKYEGQFQGFCCVDGKLSIDGQLCYEGTFASQGERALIQGSGTLYLGDGAIYRGEVAKGKPHGSGCWVSADGAEAVYADWLNGTPLGDEDAFRVLTISGDSPARLYDGYTPLIPLDGKPLRFRYAIGGLSLFIKNDKGQSLSCDPAKNEKFHYRFIEEKKPEAKPQPTEPKTKQQPAATQPQPKAERKPEPQPQPKAAPRPQPADYTAEDLWCKKGENGLWGYTHKKTNALIISYQFEDASPFCEGLAKVVKNGKYGYIDKQGQIVIDCKYDSAGIFCEGLAWVKLNNKHGYIDKKGNVVIPIQYNGVWIFTEGLAGVRRGELWGFIDITGKMAIPFVFEKVNPFKNGKAEVVYKGKPITITKNWKEPIEYADEDLKPQKGENGKYGYVYEKTGKIVIPYQFEDAWFFHEGLAAIQQNGKQGYINKQGQIVIECEYESAGNFCEGLAWVKRNNKYGYIDKKRNIVIPCQFNGVWEFGEGLAGVRRNELWGFIDKTGKTVIPYVFEKVNPFKDGKAEVVYKGKTITITKDWKEPIEYRDEDLKPQKGANGKYGYVHKKTGEVVIPYQFKSAWFFTEGFARISPGHFKYGYINKNGNIVIPCTFEICGIFSEGLAKIQLNNKWGYINKNGEIVISCQFYDAGPFHEGLASVRYGKWGFIDKTGKLIIPYLFERVLWFTEELVGVCMNDKWGFIDKKQNQVISYKFEKVLPFCEGLAAVKLNGKYGFINKKGFISISCIFDDVETQSPYVWGFKDGKAKVKQNGEWFYIDKQGRRIS